MTVYYPAPSLTYNQTCPGTGKMWRDLINWEVEKYRRFDKHTSSCVCTTVRNVAKVSTHKGPRRKFGVPVIAYTGDNYIYSLNVFRLVVQVERSAGQKKKKKKSNEVLCCRVFS